jgi:hypothetical protein
MTLGSDRMCRVRRWALRWRWDLFASPLGRGGDVLIALGKALERRRGRRHPVPILKRR